MKVDFYQRGDHLWVRYSDEVEVIAEGPTSIIVSDDPKIAEFLRLIDQAGDGLLRCKREVSGVQAEDGK